MSEARAQILRRIRLGLAAAPRPDPEIERHYATSAQHDAAQTVELFLDRVNDYRAHASEVSRQDLAASIAGCLPGQRPVVVAPPGLPRDWVGDGVQLLFDEPELGFEELDRADAVLTGASLGIAETGTLVLTHGPAEGRRALTTIPDLHICVLARDRVVATVPEALAQLDPRRPITFVSGPSATSDIELQRVEGVHGPRQLFVLVVA